MSGVDTCECGHQLLNHDLRGRCTFSECRCTMMRRALKVVMPSGFAPDSVHVSPAPGLPPVRVVNETGYALGVHGAADASGMRLVVTDGLARPGRAAMAEACAELRQLALSYRREANELPEGDLAGAALTTRADNLRIVVQWIEALK